MNEPFRTAPASDGTGSRVLNGRSSPPSGDETGSVALKEWASAVRALAEGRQIVLLRKGGIAEETREFELRSHAFLLYPTYEHQRRELLKPEYRSLVDETLAEMPPDGAVRIVLHAEVTDDIEVADQETLDRIRDAHIWTDDFAAERLKWKCQSPLHVLLVRAYALDEPAVVPFSPDYAGCKSWIRLNVRVPVGGRKPVLSDDVYARRRSAIVDRLAGRA